MVPKVPPEPYSDPSQSDFSSLDSSDSSDESYYKQRERAKNNKKKHQSKTCFNNPIKNCANLTSNILTDTYKSEFIKFKLDEDPLN